MFCTPTISLPGLDPCVGIFPVRRLQGGSWIYLVGYLFVFLISDLYIMASSEGSAFILVIKKGVH